MLRFVIFDFDGVIADSERLHFEMFRQSLETLDIQINWEEYHEKYLGYTDHDCLHKILSDRGLEPDMQTITKLFEEKKQRFADKVNQTRLIIPGVDGFLQRLQDAGIHCAICSGALKSEIELILADSGLRDHFLFIVAADDVSRGKPDPEGYRLCLQRINEIPAEKTGSSDNPAIAPPVRTSETLVIEDSHWGIQAAQQAGMRCLAVTNSYTADVLQKADRIVADLNQVTVEALNELLPEADS